MQVDGVEPNATCGFKTNLFYLFCFSCCLSITNKDEGVPAS